jgi:acid phosphatase type 7
VNVTAAGMRRWRLLAAVAFVVATPVVLCHSGGIVLPAQAADDPVVLAAGDIARCNDTGDEATAALLDNLPGTVLPLGDNAYRDGSAADYTNCYAPSWGRALSRSRPIPGNHDYVDPKAAGYFGYFGAAAGDPAKGYYSFDVGTWHLIALNSTCKAVGGCGAGSPMEQWLKADLAATSSQCIIAYWHHPRFFSPSLEPGVTKVPTTDKKMTAIWRDLQAAGADIALSGHRHVYERFARQDGNGTADPTGVRQFVVGTGGGTQEKFTGAPVANSEIRQDGVFGILQLTLHPDSYDWRFVPVQGATFTDSGSESCVAPQPTPPPPPPPA